MKLRKNGGDNAAAADRGKHDIIGSLPLELVIHVVDYLDHIDIIRNQRVSRRWRSIFSSDVVLKAILARTLPALGLEPTDIATANPMTYIRWLYGLQSARPVRKVFLRWRGSSVKPKEILCDSRRLCYLMADNDTEVVMLELETGKRSIWTNGTNSHIRTIRLSGRYLFAISWDRVVTAWDIPTSRKLGEHKFPWLALHITVAKSIAVIRASYTPGPDSICVWDLHSDRVNEFGSFLSRMCLCHANADENVLVTFVIDWDVEPIEMQQTKWSLPDGKQLEQKQFRLPIRGYHVLETDVAGTMPGQYYTFGDKTTTQAFPEEIPHSTAHFSYDYAVDQLSLRWIDCIEPANDFIFVALCGFLTPYIAYRWAQQLRSIAIYNAATGSTTLHAYQLDIHEISTRNLLGARLPPPSRPNGEHIRGNSVLISFGDREVFGLASDDGMQLWFFNPDFVPDLPDAEPFLAVEESG